ncbi:ribonuclease H-like domain-containing protein, partial [Tanacetum coccineum]
MVTRNQDGTRKTTERLNLHVSHISPIPKSSSLALSDPHWRDAMFDEYNALIRNSTWVLVPRPHGANIVRCLWLFWHKFHANGSLSRSDFGALNYFLGISVTRDTTGMFLSQKKYAMELLERAHMINYNPTWNHVDTESKLGPEGAPISDPTMYRSLAGGLQYLTFTCPNLSYVVQQICLYMHDRREPHLASLKRILRYVQGTLEFGLQLYAPSDFALVAYSDADWAGCPATRRSTSGHTETWIGLSDMDAVRVCLLLVGELVFMGKEDRNCIPRHLVSLVEDFDCWNYYPWGEYIWVKFYKRTVNVVADHRALHLDKKKQNPDYYPTYNLYGFPLAFKDSNSNLKLYATLVEQQTAWFKASIEYINGLVDLDMNVSEDDIGGDVSNNSFDLNDNAVAGNGNNDVLLLEGEIPSLADVLHELRALRKEVALFKVDDARIAKLERILNDTFIPCNDRSKGNHNSVNPGLTTSANHPLSTCSRHVVDNPARNNDSRNSNHNAVYTGLSCLANDHMSSCLSLEMPNDEVAVAGTAIHNADEIYDSPNCVIDNDVNESIGVSSNYSMLNTSCHEMHNAEVLVAGMGIDKADEKIYNSNANDNDVNQGIASDHEMPNAVVVVACMGIDKPNGHNDNPNANDNDVNKGISLMSTCFGPDMHLAEVAVAGMEIDKGDGHIDIPTASDNDVNLAKSVTVNDLMVLAICSMGFQNEVATNVVYEGNVVSSKEVGLNVLIQVACDGMGIDKSDGYSQREPSTLNALIEGFDSQKNN